MAPGAGSTALSQWVAAAAQYFTEEPIYELDQATTEFNQYGNNSPYQSDIANAAGSLQSLCRGLSLLGPPPDPTNQAAWTAAFNQLLGYSQALVNESGLGTGAAPSVPDPGTFDAEVTQQWNVLNGIQVQEIAANNG
jgi:hypothetical protein